MKELICINNENCEGNLKLGEKLQAIAEDEDKYIIQLGNGVKGHYLKSRFQEVR